MTAVQKIGMIFAAERATNGRPAHERLAARRADVAPLVDELLAWMSTKRTRLSRHNEVAKAFAYMLSGSGRSFTPR